MGNQQEKLTGKQTFWGWTIGLIILAIIVKLAFMCAFIPLAIGFCLFLCVN